MSDSGRPPPPEGAVGPLGRGGVKVECMRDIFILNGIWVQGKIYYFDRHIAWLKDFTYPLVPALAPNYNVPERPLVRVPIRTLLEYPYELGVWDFDPVHILILLEV
jgi:hypothetical protein